MPMRRSAGAPAIRAGTRSTGLALPISAVRGRGLSCPVPSGLPVGAPPRPAPDQLLMMWCRPAGLSPVAPSVQPLSHLRPNLRRITFNLPQPAGGPGRGRPRPAQGSACPWPPRPAPPPVLPAVIFSEPGRVGLEWSRPRQPLRALCCGGASSNHICCSQSKAYSTWRRRAVPCRAAGLPPPCLPTCRRPAAPPSPAHSEP